MDQKRSSLGIGIKVHISGLAILNMRISNPILHIAQSFHCMQGAFMGRIVVPPPGRACVLAELYGGHLVISRMKSIAGIFVWWPGDGQDH